MGCGASQDTSHVQAPVSKKKPTLPPIGGKTKPPSAKSNGSTDSGIDDSEPLKPFSKTLAINETLRVEHHQRSRLGNGETFDIMAGPKPGRLAPIKHVPRVLQESKQTPAIDPDLHAKIAAKLERASRKRRELEDARRLASSRIGHRPPTRARGSSPPRSTTSGPYEGMSKRDERHQQLSMLRDQLRHNDTQSPTHTPRTPRGESVSSGMTDVARGTPRRAGHVVGATTASNFKPVYD